MQNGGLVGKGVDIDGLGDQIAELAAHIDAAMHGLLTAIREFDQALGWAKQGAVSCAHWLAWRIGWDLTTARERLRVAKKLGELRLVDEELRLGAMSYSKARAISRVATASNEQLWVEYAKRMPASGLDKLCRSFAGVLSNVAMKAEYVAAKRAATRRTLDDGMVKIELVLTNDEAAIVWTAINAGLAAVRGTVNGTAGDAANNTCGDATHNVSSGKIENTNTSDVSQPTPHTSAEASAPAAAAPQVTLTMQRADAVMAIFNERVRGNRPQRSPVEIIVTVPLAGLHASAEASPQHLAMTADGEPLAAATARRLCCDAGVVTAVVDAAGQPLSVGRKTRTIPTAIHRALLLRDRTCRFPGCTHRHFVDGHHVEHWVNGGATALHNLVLLCGTHHRLVHEGGFSVEANDAASAATGHGIGTWRFSDPRGHLVSAQPERTPGSLARLRHNNILLAITARTNAPLWTGAPIEYDRCVEYLLD